MKDEYIDMYGIDSLPNLFQASLNKCDVFVTINKEMLEDREELEKTFKIKIRTPAEMIKHFKSIKEVDKK